MSKNIVIASGNKGKLREIEQVVTPLGFSITPQTALGITDADETGLTFIENALIKARHAATITQQPALADDSGLEVDFLQGQPGIYSSRYAGTDASDSDNVSKLLQALEGVPEQQRTARFQCVIVYLRHANDPTPIICQGSWEGRIATAPAGESGFGYDPVFYVPSEQCVAAELTADTKNKLSHRGKALAALIEQFKKNPQYMPAD